jgi:hypothetical protein
LGKDDSVCWDGLSAKKERLPIGMYLIYIEIFNLEGQVNSYKKSCVIGGKFK